MGKYMYNFLNDFPKKKKKKKDSSDIIDLHTENSPPFNNYMAINRSISTLSALIENSRLLYVFLVSGCVLFNIQTNYFYLKNSNSFFIISLISSLHIVM